MAEIEKVKLPNDDTIYDIKDAKAIRGLASGTTSGHVLQFGADGYTVSDSGKSMSDKQDTIDSSHKLSADLIDDTNATNKFATAAQLDQIETNKNNILNCVKVYPDIIGWDINCNANTVLDNTLYRLQTNSVTNFPTDYPTTGVLHYIVTIKNNSDSGAQRYQCIYNNEMKVKWRRSQYQNNWTAWITVETDGLASKDIGAMTGYAKASTGSAIATTDTLNQAIGKVEKRVDVNENNILSVQGKVKAHSEGGTDYDVINGIRVYVSATQPTGDIPVGSLWIGG